MNFKYSNNAHTWEQNNYLQLYRGYSNRNNKKWLSDFEILQLLDMEIKMSFPLYLLSLFLIVRKTIYNLSKLV